MEFCNILKMLREDEKITQKELSKKLNLAQSIISNWENAINQPTAEAIIKLANFFNVTTDYLLGLEDDAGYKYNKITINNLFENNEEEKELLKYFNNLSPALKNETLRFIQGLLVASGKNIETLK